ncbi:MAG: NAD-binding protein [bacterium]|jgi:putative dehydrogenase
MRVGVIGLGSIGLGMAASLKKAGHDVIGVDLAQARRGEFEALGGRASASAADAAADADCVFCVVVNAAQTESVLFGAQGVAERMPKGAVFLSCATLPPEAARTLGARLQALGRHYLDTPTSGGAARALAGEITIMGSGAPAAFDAVAPALEAVAAKVYRLGDAPGAGSAMKLVNQLLAGVHIAAACEAMAFAIRLGLEPRQVYDVITHAAGSSWMFENRVPHILDGDYAPKSAVSIFTKDLGIVLDAARASQFPIPMAGMGLQMFEMAAAAGMAQDDDASVARVYARLAGLTLPGGKP